MTMVLHDSQNEPVQERGSDYWLIRAVLDPYAGVIRIRLAGSALQSQPVSIVLLNQHPVKTRFWESAGFPATDLKQSGNLKDH